MTFTYQNGLEVVKHYQFLRGLDMQGGNETPVTDIVLAPVDDDQLDAFFAACKTAGNAQKALDIAGYDKNQVQVIIMNLQKDGVDLWEEIDSFLEKNKLDRVYLNPAFFTR